MVTPVAMEPLLGYHPCSTGFLTMSRDPAMGAEVLEEMEMEPFVEEVEGFASGKKILLFGSYGWGDGQWMRDWEERMSGAGAELVNGEGFICQEMPDDAAVDELKSLGKQMAQM